MNEYEDVEIEESGIEDDLDRFRTDIGEAIEKLGIDEVIKMLVVHCNNNHIKAYNVKSFLNDELCSNCKGSGSIRLGVYGAKICSDCKGSGYKNPKFGVRVKDNNGKFLSKPKIYELENGD